MSNRDLAAAMMRMMQAGYSIRFDRISASGKTWCELYEGDDLNARACALGPTYADGLRDMFADFAFMRL